MSIRFRSAVALTAGTLLLAGCGSAPDKAADNPKDDTFPTSVALDKNYDPEAHFSYAGAYPPSSFDPFTSASGLDQTYLAPIYDRLIYRAPNGDLKPMLATDWKASDDNKSLIVTLQKGLSFTDGAPFDAQAVKTNIDRYLGAGSKLKQELTQVTGIEIVDPLTVQFNVSDSLGALPATLAARAGMMVSPQAIASGDVASHPVGIGPYTATAVVPGTSVDLVKTEKYWDPDVQRVATMQLNGMPEAQTRYNAVVSGQLTAAEISAEQIAPAQREGLDLLSGPTPLFYFFAVNTAVAPFDNPEVREAISMAIDREGIGQGMFEGYCKPSVQLWPESSEMYDEKFGDGLDKMPYDVEKAKKLIKDANIDPNASYDAVLNNNSTSTKLAEVLQSNLAEVGLKINVKPVPSGGIIANFAVDKSMPTTVSGYTGPPDPAAVIDRNFTTSAPYNPGKEVYADMDKAAEKGANTVDPAERKAAYAEFMSAFVKSAPHVIPVCMSYRLIAYSNVTNLYASSDYVDLRGVAVSTKK